MCEICRQYNFASHALVQPKDLKKMTRTMVDHAGSAAAISRSSLAAAAGGSAGRRVRDTTSFGPSW